MSYCAFGSRLTSANAGWAPATPADKTPNGKATTSAASKTSKRIRFIFWPSSWNRIDPLRPMLTRSINYPGGRRGPYPSPYQQNVQSLLDMLKGLVNGTEVGESVKLRNKMRSRLCPGTFFLS